MSEILKSPWTAEQVDQLNINQGVNFLHPYKCGTRARYHSRSASVLLATEAGWVCLDCGYIQDWCHAFSAKPVTAGQPWLTKAFLRSTKH